MNIFAYLQDPANWFGPDNILDLLLAAPGLHGRRGGDRGGDRHPAGHPDRPHRPRLVPGHRAEQRRPGHPVARFAGAGGAAAGTGFGKTVFVLTLLALPAILTATAAGIHGADREAVHAARALGMSEGQVVGKVEWPLALPLVISGLRSATLQVVATATVAAFVGGGGLGRLLITGQRTQRLPADVRRRVPGRPAGHRARSAARRHRLAGRATGASAHQDDTPATCSLLHNLVQRSGIDRRTRRSQTC